MIHRACLCVASLQMLKAIREYRDEALRDMLQSRPARYISLLNTVCNLANANLKQAEQRHQPSK